MANYIGNLQNKNGDLLFPIDMEVIENDNGTALKFSNGVMICTMIKSCQFDMTTGIAWGPLYVWTNSDKIYYPQKFIDIPTIHISEYQDTTSTSNILLNYDKPIITTDYYQNVAICRPNLSSNNNGNVNFSFIAIGKWK